MLTESEIRTNYYHVHKLIDIRINPDYYYMHGFNLMESAKNYKLAAEDEAADLAYGHPTELEIQIGEERWMPKHFYKQMSHEMRSCRREMEIDYQLSMTQGTRQ